MHAIPEPLQQPIYDALHGLSAHTVLSSKHRHAVQDIALICFHSTSRLAAMQALSPTVLAVLLSLARASLYIGALHPNQSLEEMSLEEDTPARTLRAKRKE